MRNIVVTDVNFARYQIHIPLPPKIDPTVTMMQVDIYLLGLDMFAHFADRLRRSQT